MGDICPAPESYGASHARMSANNIKYCQFCGARCSRTNTNSVETLVINDDDDTFTVSNTNSWKPNNRSKSTKRKSYEDKNLSPADRHALVPRKPAPSPLMLKREATPLMMTAIPASSEMDKRLATEFFLEAAKFSNIVRDRSSKKNPPHNSATNWYPFNVTISITKWTVDHNSPLLIPVYTSGSFQIIHNFDTSVRGTRIINISDWWERLASAAFVRKKEFAGVYPVAFYKNLTKTSFTDLDIEAQRAQDVRTVWDSLPPAKSQGGKEYRRIHVTYQDIKNIPKKEDTDSEPEPRTNDESDEDEKDAVRVKIEKGQRKRKASTSISAGSSRRPPPIKRSDSDESLPSLKSIFKSPSRTTKSPPRATPSPPAESSDEEPYTPTRELAIRTTPANSPQANLSQEASLRISSRITKAIPATRYGE
ncbi:hypothetical protein M434DRAFT_28742 [Hypoxylon sp. CO27-5]|nr:hypothetical protein M434DRAFT_28742 [Hypoxylon sp. CO27-5]